MVVVDDGGDDIGFARVDHQILEVAADGFVDGDDEVLGAFDQLVIDGADVETDAVAVGRNLDCHDTI
ncbi:hypothetical protein D3C76_1677200 [compost metagenome]